MILLLAVIGTLILALLGMVWYFPSTPMGKIHMKYLGFDTLSKEDQQKKMNELSPHMWKTYVLQMMLSLLIALATVYIITMSVKNGVSHSMAFGFVMINWLCFMVPVVGSNILWSNIDRSIAWRKFFSDIFFHFVSLVLITLLVSVFVK